MSDKNISNLASGLRTGSSQGPQVHQGPQVQRTQGAQVAQGSTGNNYNNLGSNVASAGAPVSGGQFNVNPNTFQHSGHLYQGQPGNQVPANIQGVQSGGQVSTVDTDAFSIFGQTIQKKYAYILGGLLLLVVGYMAWTWYNKKSKEDDEEDFDEDEDISYEQQMQQLPPHLAGQFGRRMPPMDFFPNPNQNRPNFGQNPNGQNPNGQQQGPHMQGPQPGQQVAQPMQGQHGQNQPMTDQQFDSQINQAVQEDDL